MLLLPLLGLLLAGPHPLMQEYNRAWQLEGQHRADEAIPLLKAIIAKDKTFYRAYEVLVRAYSQKNQLEPAERYFRSLLAEDSTNGLAHYGLGRVYEEKREYNSASEEFAACVHEPVRCHLCFTEFVASYFAGHKRNISLEDLKTRIPLDPSSPYTLLALTAMYILQRNLPEARRTAEEGLKLAKASGDQELILEFHRRLAQAISPGTEVDPAGGLPHVLEAVRIAQELEDWRLCLDSTREAGIMYDLLGRTEEAREHFERYLELAQNLGRLEWEAGAHSELGLFQARHGNHDEAIRHFRAGIKLWEERPEQNIIFGLLRDLGDVYRAQGNAAEALRCYEESRRRAADTAHPWDEAFALRLIGNLYGNLGDYFRALDFGLQSVRLFREISFAHVAGAGVGYVGLIYEALGDYSNARKSFVESYQSALRHQDVFEQGRLLSALGGLSLRTGNAKDALRYLEQALVLSERSPNKVFDARTRLSMGGAYSQLGRRASALESSTAGLALAREVRNLPLEAEALTAVAECHLRAGDLARAEESFSRGLELAEQIGLTPVALSARRGLAETARRRGDLNGSLGRLRAAIEALEAMRSRLPAPDLRAGFVQENWRVYEDAVYVLSLLHQRDPSRGYDREAFHVAERGRARSLLDTLAESKARITKGLTAEQRERQTALLAALSKASGALLKEGSGANRRALEQAEKGLSDWVLEIRRSNPAYLELQYPEPYDAAKAQREAAIRGSAILEYSLGQRRSEAWLVTARGFEMVSLPARAVIEKEVRQFRDMVARRPKDAAALQTWRASAERLHETLVEPLRRRLPPGQPLVVVPDGILHYLPFETLLGPAPERRFLIEDHDITYAPSASSLGSLPRGAGAKRRELLAFGDPVFSPEQARPTEVAGLVRGVYGRAGVGLPALPSTRVEVERLAALYPAEQRKVYLGRDASEAALKGEKLAEYRRLHFATHALLDEQAPWRSGVVLSLVNTGDEDGVLQMNEIFNLDLDAEMVVLSACQTGLGKLVRGEGMIGLTRAFLYAGSPRVVVSLWEVNDLATADFMAAFYQAMRRGAVPAAALREAKLSFLRSDTPAYRHPYFWAPFVLIGAR